MSKSEKSTKNIQNGKGSKRRPMFISNKQLEKNWQRIFGKKNHGNASS